MVISHSVKNGLNSVLIALAASGCLFSAEAGDTDGDTDGTDTEAAETGAMTSSPASTSTSTTSTSTTSTSDPSTSTSDPSTTDDTSTSTGSEATCDPFAAWVWAVDVPDEDTTFVKTDADILPPIEGEPVVFLRSVMANQGTAALSFDIPCTDDAIFWALAWDSGEEVDNADAYQIGLDQSAEEVTEDGVRWEYGCDNNAIGWAWYRVRETGFECDPDGELEATLDEGEHHLQINNAEPVSGSPQFNFTGLAALVVTNDPEYDPRTEYDPTPRD